MDAVSSTVCPPADVTCAERATLGAVLLNPGVFQDVFEIFAPHHEQVYLDERHRTLWGAFCALHDAGRPIDSATILDYASTQNLDEALGGAAYMAKLLRDTPTSANATHYARAVRERFERAGISRAANQLQRDISNGEAPETALELFHTSVRRICLCEAWPDPRPLPTVLPPEVFDPDLLPDAVRPWIVDIAERIQCPLDYPAAAWLVSFGSLVGRQIAIRPKQHDDWQEVPNLWGAIVGPPGVLKSPALTQVMGPLHTLEARAIARHELDTHAAQASAMVAAVGKKENERAIKAALKANDSENAHEIATRQLEAEANSVPPLCRRYVCNSATVEKLGVLLTSTPSGLLVFRDELSGFLRGLEKQGQEESRTFYLEAWNGQQPFTYDRIGRGTTRIEAATVSIFGTIQPGPLAAYLRENCHGGGNDGFVPRFQVMVFPEPRGEWRNVDRWPDTVAKCAAHALFESVECLDANMLGATLENGAIPYLRFNNAAQSMLDGWRTELESRLRDNSLHPIMQEHLSKYRGLVPSIALLMHLADGVRGPVGESALQKGLAWGEYLESHARRVYGLLLRSEDDAARLLLQRIAAGSLTSPFTERDVYRNQWSGLDKAATSSALAVLECHGHLRVEEIGSGSFGGRSTRRYHLHPIYRLEVDALG